MKIYLTTLLILLSLSSSSFARNVMTWIPVYGIGNCKAILNDATKSQWIKNGITHIGLQFWVPGDAGAVTFATDYKYTWKASTISQDVQDIVTWGHANNIKVLLCFYNMREGDFDWNYTQQVINDYPEETITNMMTVIDNYGLDGVDIDFEGVGSFSGDKPAFVNFLDGLGDALHEDGKELSVDMFSTPCYNAPNPSWESAMAPHVDFMNIMGYNDTYENNNTLFSYCPETPSQTNSRPLKYSYIENYLTEKQEVASSKLNYGLPAWDDEWGGQCAQENILDILDVSTAGGIAIWDMQLSGGDFWTDPATWTLINKFRDNHTSAEIREEQLICGIVTALDNATSETSSMYYDAANQSLHLPGRAGQLYLYSVTGVLERSWDIQGEENVSFSNIRNGFYLIKFETATEIISQRISILK